MTTIGKEKETRIDKGLKQKYLLMLTDLTQKYLMVLTHLTQKLSLIENDGVDPATSVLRKIALALGVSADQLLGITQEQEG